MHAIICIIYIIQLYLFWWSCLIFMDSTCSFSATVESLKISAEKVSVVSNYLTIFAQGEHKNYYEEAVWDTFQGSLVSGKLL